MNAVVKREPRAMEVKAKFVVRNIQAESFDDAKAQAMTFAKPYLVGWPSLAPRVSRELDHSYTVEFV